MLSLRRPKKISEISTLVPSGLIAHTEKGYFLVKGLKRFKFTSDRARESWNLKIIPTKEIYISDIKISGMVGFRDGTLIKDISSSKIYLISDNLKRHIISPDIIKMLGYDKSEILIVSQKETTFHKEGDPLHG